MQLLIAKFTGNGIQRGDIVEARASSTPFGGNEPNSFVLVEIPEPLSSLGQYGNVGWRREIDWVIQSSDLVNDVFVLRVTNTLTNSQSTGALLREHIERYLADWNIAVVGEPVNGVDIQVDIGQVLRSKEFWNHNFDTQPVTITELNYDQATGVHRLELDYSAINKNPTAVERRAVDLGGEVISHSNKILVVDFARADVRDKFFADVKRKVNSDRSIFRYRYKIPENVVTFIEGQGGAYNTDLATAAGYIIDKVSE